MENDLACEDYYESTEIDECEEYTIEDFFTFSETFDPLYEKYQ